MEPEKILESKPVSLSSVEELLSKRKKEKELTFEQDLTLIYAKKFTKLNEEKTNKLIEELMKIEAIDKELAIKIADVLPVKKEILELMIPKNIKVEEKDLGQILSLTEKYAPKKK